MRVLVKFADFYWSGNMNMSMNFADLKISNAIYNGT